jgi:hypothetical protein
MIAVAGKKEKSGNMPRSADLDDYESQLPVLRSFSSQNQIGLDRQGGGGQNLMPEMGGPPD